MFNPPCAMLSTFPCGLILLGTETIKVQGPQAVTALRIIPPQFSAIYHVS